MEVATLDGLVDLDHGAWTGLTREEAAVSQEIPIRLVAARPSGSGDEGFWDLDAPIGSATELEVSGGRPILRCAPRTPPP